MGCCSKKKKADSKTAKITFKPGKLGITFSGNVITTVQPGTPAQRLGVRPGWTILSINGEKQSGNHKQVLKAIGKTHNNKKPTTFLFQKTVMLPQKQVRKQQKQTNRKPVTQAKKQKTKKVSKKSKCLRWMIYLTIIIFAIVGLFFLNDQQLPNIGTLKRSLGSDDSLMTQLENENIKLQEEIQALRLKYSNLKDEFKNYKIDNKCPGV